jgi:sugar phosphate isomerase/epimerase
MEVVMAVRGEPSIAFSTLACPEWTVDEVVDRASVLGYDAIEWRGGPEGHVRVDWLPDRRRALREAMDARGLRSLAVTAYTSFVSPVADARRANLDVLLRHLELAANLEAPFVRAFVGAREDDAPLERLVLRAAEPLSIAAAAAESLGASICLEPHDDFVSARATASVVTAVGHRALGVVWDVANAWEVGEPPDVGASTLGAWIRYLHLKDGWRSGDTWQLTDFGEGNVPLREALALLAQRGQLPPLSVEWERPWHPELAPAADALGPALKAVRGLVDAVLSGA